MPQLLAGVAWHIPEGSAAPAATSLQKPTKPLTLQARQRPQLSMLQQTPLVQKPVPHWASLLQLAPWDFSRQVLLLQVLGATQSPSLRQVEMQVPLPWQRNGLQLRVEGIWQVPLPLQVEGGVATLPLHEPARQVVPATYFRQPPLPSHLPSRPQLLVLSATQARMGSSAPAATGAQLPWRPDTLQAWQLLQVAVSQQ